MSKLKALTDRLVKTSTEKNLFTESNSLQQAYKTQEELDELKQSLTAKQNNLTSYINSKGELVNTRCQIIDDYGDILVTIFNGMHMEGVDILEAFEKSLVIFENRKGKMIKGKFVKDEN